ARSAAPPRLPGPARADLPSGRRDPGGGTPVVPPPSSPLPAGSLFPNRSARSTSVLAARGRSLLPDERQRPLVRSPVGVNLVRLDECLEEHVCAVVAEPPRSLKAPRVEAGDRQPAARAASLTAVSRRGLEQPERLAHLDPRGVAELTHGRGERSHARA